MYINMPFKSIKDKVKSWVGSVKDKVPTDLASIKDKVNSWVDGIKDKVPVDLGNIKDTVAASEKSLIWGLKSVTSSISETSNAVSETTNRVASSITWVIDKVSRTFWKFKNLWELLQEIEETNIEEIKEVDKNLVWAVENLLLWIDVAMWPIIWQIIWPFVIALSWAWLLFAWAHSIQVRLKQKIMLPKQVLKKLNEDPSNIQMMAALDKSLELLKSNDEFDKKLIQELLELNTLIWQLFNKSIKDSTLDTWFRDLGLIRSRHNFYFLNVQEELKRRNPNIDSLIWLNLEISDLYKQENLDLD